MMRYLDQALNAAAIVLFLAIFALVLMQIGFRYFINSPLTWSEELTRYLFIWLCFTGWAIALRRGTHIRVQAVYDLLPASLRKGLDFLVLLATAYFAYLMVRWGLVLVEQNRNVPAVAIDIPYALVYLSVPLFGLLVFIVTIDEFLKLMKGST